MLDPSLTDRLAQRAGPPAKLLTPAMLASALGHKNEVRTNQLVDEFALSGSDEEEDIQPDAPAIEGIQSPVQRRSASADRQTPRGRMTTTARAARRDARRDIQSTKIVGRKRPLPTPDLPMFKYPRKSGEVVAPRFPLLTPLPEGRLTAMRRSPSPPAQRPQPTPKRAAAVVPQRRLLQPKRAASAPQRAWADSVVPDDAISLYQSDKRRQESRAFSVYEAADLPVLKARSPSPQHIDEPQHLPRQLFRSPAEGVPRDGMRRGDMPDMHVWAVSKPPALVARVPSTV